MARFLHFFDETQLFLRGTYFDGLRNSVDGHIGKCFVPATRVFSFRKIFGEWTEKIKNGAI
jgi:hypothetical protein